MDKEKLQEILRKHKQWLSNDYSGEKADLSYADLSYADLTGAKLNWCNTQDILGQKIISVQVDTTRKNNQISYWVDLDIWTTGCFQGSLDELKKVLKKSIKTMSF